MSELPDDSPSAMTMDHDTQATVASDASDDAEPCHTPPASELAGEQDDDDSGTASHSPPDFTATLPCDDRPSPLRRSARLAPRAPSSSSQPVPDHP